MKKLLALVMTFALAMSMVACSSAPASSEAGTETPSLDTTALTELYMFVDGQDVTDGNTTYDSISAKFAEAEVDGNKYTATTLTNL
ncbi:MAG: hypothetical protein IJN59_04230, partial [Oscillospiraceae bacterium]|nr:hypothetical protein [Oscillospiraceae bacterium]